MVHLEGYTLGEALGEGAFAVCRLGHKNTNPGAKVAVKSVMRNHQNFDPVALKHEISIMQAINHPRCVNLLEVVEDEAAVHLVEELAAGGELFDRIIEMGSLTEKDAAHLIHQVFDGIQYLHTQGMIHRDLKPENVLMVGREPGTEEYMMLKLCDFGLSVQRTEAMTDKDWRKMRQTFCGTQDYLAPEVFRIAQAPGEGLHYTAKVDVWAAGTIYYIMLCGTPPFWAENDDMKDMIASITSGLYEFYSPEWDEISEESKDMIRRCLAVDISERATAMELMSHKLFDNDRLPNAKALNNSKALLQYKTRLKMKRAAAAVKASIRFARSASFSSSTGKLSRSSSFSSMHSNPDPEDDRNKEALAVFNSIDALGDKNGELELYEIILYMQDNLSHLFTTKGLDGLPEIDEEKLKSFATTLRDEIDRNGDMVIDKEEFVMGYCIWKMQIAKEEESAKKKTMAAAVYD